MRLFFAILPDECTRRVLVHTCDDIRPQLSRGSLTLPDNLHLTLEFLGEIAPGRLDALHHCMHLAAQQAAPFTLTLAGLGQFPRGQSSILWMGVAPQPMLSALQSHLHSLLAEQGFALDARPYQPHITLGRNLRLTTAFDCLAAATPMMPSAFDAQRISLMHSTRVDGVLRYIEIAHAPLSA